MPCGRPRIHWEAGESGFTEAQVFSAPLGSYDDGSFYGQLTARQKACYDALASISLTQILHAAEVDGYRQVQVRWTTCTALP